MAGIGSVSNTMFSGAPTDDVLLVDPKDVTTNAPKTSYVSKVTGGLNKAAEFFRDNPRLVSDSMDLADTLRSKDMTPQEKLARLDGVFGKFGNSVANLTAPIRNAMMNALPPGTAEMATKVGMQVGKAYGVYESVKDVGDVRGALQALERFTGEYGLSEIIDISAEVAFLQVMNDEMVSMGHPGILDVIDERLNKDKTGNLRHDYYVASWPTYVQYGKLDQLETIMESISPDTLMGYHPGSIRILLERYSMPSGTTPDQYPTYKDQLIRVLNQLDINWGRYRRVTDTIWDLSVFTNASLDTTLVLQMDDLYRVPLTIARAYPDRDINDTITTMYRDYHFTPVR